MLDDHRLGTLRMIPAEVFDEEIGELEGLKMFPGGTGIELGSHGKMGKRESAQGLDVRVVEDEGIGGDEGHPIDARAGDENAVGGIAVDGFEQRPGFLDDFTGDGQKVPTVGVEEGAEPGFPMAVDLDSPSLLKAGDFADGDG